MQTWAWNSLASARFLMSLCSSVKILPTASEHFEQCAWLMTADERCAVWSDEVVLFVAAATEVLPAFERLVVDEISELTSSTPLINQVWDEIDTWLDGEDEAWLKRTAEAERAEAETWILLLATWIADVNLTIILHVMHIHTHHVT